MKVDLPGTHGEAPSSACGYCHQPHNAARPVLWRDTPEEQGGPIETLCRQCHREGGEAAEHAVAGHGHPLGRMLDGRVNGPLPLYNTGGERLTHGKRGLLDCGTCHDPHRWSPDSTDAAYQMQDEGGASNSFLRISAAPGSDLCRTCHRQQATVLRTGHDMRITAPEARNHSGGTVMESGVCGQCHLPHNAVSEEFLWARSLEPRSVPGENRCTGCHSREGVARNHVPLKLSHPDEVLVWGRDIQLGSRNHHLPVIPVYGEDGREDLVGRISCASCHDPHRWDPRRKAPGPGKPVEGNALNSFLRHALSAGIVCADCHGEDALFRYKYFHGLTSRRDYPLYR
ncbi:MAG TPA: hypothetical protein ENJ01_07420 [Gammaproteobacteria bacterium]|nr:hypothetical protein [Gammaproteobacteria bacterium]